MMGCAAPGAGADQRVMNAQLRFADGAAWLRRAMNLFGILFLWKVFGCSISHFALGAWSGAVMVSMTVGIVASRRRNGSRKRDVDARDLRLHGLGGFSQGVFWA